ncbi:hypothetical protein [Pseudogemmobacter sonorensis]|uniref:hypothetical protein n=1 Tax=Pseudogemmobacter sonorensis TaxID=2989681 RepID=UPI0036747624
MRIPFAIVVFAAAAFPAPRLLAEDMPGLVLPALPCSLSCHFEQKCTLAEGCESLSLAGELSVTAGSFFGQEAVLTIGDARIILQPPLVGDGDWIGAEFVTFSGVSAYMFPDTSSVSLLTRNRSGDTVYTVHNRDMPRAVSWHGICNEAAS